MHIFCFEPEGVRPDAFRGLWPTSEICCVRMAESGINQVNDGRVPSAHQGQPEAHERAGLNKHLCGGCQQLETFV